MFRDIMDRSRVLTPGMIRVFEKINFPHLKINENLWLKRDF